MQYYQTAASRIAAGASAFAISLFLIAVSFAPPGAALLGSAASSGMVA